MKLFQVLAIAIGLILVTWRPVAQADTAATPTFEQLQIQIAILKDQINVLQRENAEFRKKTFAADRDLYGALVELKKKEYAYYGDLMDINVQAFHAQKIASYIVLLLVLIVVVAGILFSGFQLWKIVSVAGVQSN